MWLLIVVYVGYSSNYPLSGFDYPRTNHNSKEQCLVAADRIKNETAIVITPSANGSSGSRGELHMLSMPRGY
jgi:hypothetical protein